MKSIKRLLVFLLAVIPIGAGAKPPSLHAVLTSVAGQVTVKDAGGGVRGAPAGSDVLEGETVLTGKDGRAGLEIFDGSTLELKASTQLAVFALRKPSAREKIIRFLLQDGGLQAAVKKLMTASSLFEVEAGGTVCGVRGTRFSMDYQAGPEKLDLRVMEGTVYAKANGEIHFYHAGEEMEFLKGSPALPKAESRPPAGPPGETFSLSLADMNQQFVLGLSPMGRGLGTPHLAGMAGLGTGSLSSSGAGLFGNTNLIGILPLKLPH